jgi:hypothetical protein
MSEAEIRVIDIQHETLDLERDKLELERAKLVVEKQKAAWTAIGIAVPIVVVAATVMFGVWSQYQKGRDDFALKSAEIIMAGSSPIATKNKAQALAALFPSQLPVDFAKSFDPDAYGHADTRALRERELVNLMVSHPAEADKVLAIWKAMYPGYEWLGEFENRLTSNSSFRGAAPGRR